MEETKEQQSLYRLLQFSVYISLAVELLLFGFLAEIPKDGLTGKIMLQLVASLRRLPVYQELLYSKFFTLGLILLVSIGTLSRKKRDFNSRRLVIIPLVLGLGLGFSGIYLHSLIYSLSANISIWRSMYALSGLLGTILVHVSMDNISKIIATSLGQDRWNIEEESFMQPVRVKMTPYSVNIPMLFYYRRRVRSGWINIDNIFRGTLLIGTPGSGKSFGIVNSFIRQLIAKDFTACIYDFKFV